VLAVRLVVVQARVRVRVLVLVMVNAFEGGQSRV
jgi:hypothetical protein